MLSSVLKERSTVNYTDPTIPERFWMKVRIRPQSDCWCWTGGMNKNGYGAQGRKAPYSGSGLTHRYTWEMVFGPVPNGKELDHFACKRRDCCNPYHLEAV